MANFREKLKKAKPSKLIRQALRLALGCPTDFSYVFDIQKKEYKVGNFQISSMLYVFFWRD